MVVLPDGLVSACPTFRPLIKTVFPTRPERFVWISNWVYNNYVNRLKIIHVLLVALVCYGQVVSHVHVVSHLQVSHLQSHQSECSSQFVDGCNTAGHSVVEMLHVASQMGDHTHTHADPDTAAADSVENNCSIYHAVLNLSDALCPTYSNGTVTIQSSLQSNSSVTHTTTSALNDARIRAPPVYS